MFHFLAQGLYYSSMYYRTYSYKPSTLKSKGQIPFFFSPLIDCFPFSLVFFSYFNCLLSFLIIYFLLLPLSYCFCSIIRLVQKKMNGWCWYLNPRPPGECENWLTPWTVDHAAPSISIFSLKTALIVLKIFTKSLAKHFWNIYNFFINC
jgi:hypothetical protein